MEGEGKMDIRSFVVASIDLENVIDKKMVRNLFRHFDRDDSGYICITEFTNVFA